MEKEQHYVRVKDGDDICVLADVDPSVQDPAKSVEAVAQVYRVIANMTNLVLVPVAPETAKISQANSPNWQERFK